MSRDSKNVIRLRIHTRIRRKVKGTPERPRLAVFRSEKHIYAQVIDDTAGHTVVAASSSENPIRKMWFCLRSSPRSKARASIQQPWRD